MHLWCQTKWRTRLRGRDIKALKHCQWSILQHDASYMLSFIAVIWNKRQCIFQLLKSSLSNEVADTLAWTWQSDLERLTRFACARQKYKQFIMTLILWILWHFLPVVSLNSNIFKIVSLKGTIFNMVRWQFCLYVRWQFSQRQVTIFPTSGDNLPCFSTSGDNFTLKTPYFNVRWQFLLLSDVF